MKNKIINAIDKGLMNILSTDIEDKNIDFNTEDIDNEYLQPVTLKELAEYSNDYYKKVDTAEVLTLIDINGNEMPLHQYTGQDIQYINLKACEENGYIDTVLHKNLKIEKLKWAITYLSYERFNKTESIPDINMAILDFKGFSHTYNNVNITGKSKLTKVSNYPAIEYCQNQSDDICIGYLPAAGQMKFISDNLLVINNIMKYIGGTAFSDKADIRKYWYGGTPPTYDSCNYWVSTEQSYIDGYMFSIETNTLYGRYTKNKFDWFILPIFKKRRP